MNKTGKKAEKKVRLVEIDLSRTCEMPDSDGDGGESWHPDIKLNRDYLALLGSKDSQGFFAGQFSKEWFGLDFDGWGDCGLQLDKPGTNGSLWMRLWLIDLRKA